MIILEQCTVRVDPSSTNVPYGFSIGKYHPPCSFCIFLSFFHYLPWCIVTEEYIDDASAVVCMQARFLRFHVACEATSKRTLKKCCSFRRRLISTVRREYSRGTGQLVAGAATGQLRVHAEPVVIVAPAHRGLQWAQARHRHTDVAVAARDLHRCEYTYFNKNTIFRITSFSLHGVHNFNL